MSSIPMDFIQSYYFLIIKIIRSKSSSLYVYFMGCIGYIGVIYSIISNSI